MENSVRFAAGISFQIAVKFAKETFVHFFSAHLHLNIDSFQISIANDQWRRKFLMHQELRLLTL